MSQTFGDLELAAKTKEVISTLVRKEVEKLRPSPRYATVATLDPLTVTYPGDPTPMPVKTGSVVPSAVGQIVRIEGPLGDRYIADVVGAEEGVEPYEPGGSNEFPDGVTIGEDPNDVVLLPTPPGDVTGLAVTQGLEFENIYFIIEWDLIANASQYDVEVAEKLGANTYDLTRVLRVSGTTARVDGLQPFVEYGVRVTAVSNIGLRGNSTVWLDVITTGDNTIPPQVSLPELSRGATSLIVSFDPLDSLAAPDVANGNGLYEVQIDTANTFDTANLRSYLGTSSIIAFSDLTFEATWYARVRGIDTSGNLGAWSNVASLVAGAITSTQILDGAITEVKITDDAITTPKIAANAVIAEHILAGQINSDKIVTAGLDAAVIKFGTMSGDRILANSMSVNRLATSTLTSTTITLGSGGSLKIGNPTTDGIFINSLGIRAYKAGVTTFNIDSSGNATFGGNLDGATGTFEGSLSSPTITSANIYSSRYRTATTGNRIEIGSQYGETGDIRSSIYFYDGSYSTPGFVGTSYGILTMRPPGDSVNAGNISVSAAGNVTIGGSQVCYMDMMLDAGGGNIISNNGTTSQPAYRFTSGGTSGMRYSSGVRIVESGSDKIWIKSSDGSVNILSTLTVSNKWYAPGMLGSAAGGDTVRRYTGSGNELFYFTSTEKYKALIRKSSRVADEYVRKAMKVEIPTWNALTEKEGLRRVMTRGQHDRGTHVDRIGPIIEEMQYVFPEAVLFDDDMIPNGIDEGLIIATLWRAVQLITQEMNNKGMKIPALAEQG